MREVQATCGKCGRSYAYFSPEPGDYTDPNQWTRVIVDWSCPYCGYGRYIESPAAIETEKYSFNISFCDEEFIVTPKKKLMDLLKEISKEVCLEICGKFCDDAVCRKCSFMISLNC